ncbi:MAG: HPr family phosphocarrier protein [Planctomycetaceae bacterium]
MADSATLRRQVRLAIRHGLHLSPIQFLVKAMAGHSAEVTVHFGGKQANARSAMDLMLLGATFGSELLIEATGEDAQAALDAAAELLQTDRTSEGRS